MVKRKETKSDTLTVRLSPRVKDAYEALANQEERTVSHLASEVLADWMGEHHPNLIPAPSLFDSAGGICQVPLYDVRAAAGDGNFISEENLEKHMDLTRRFVADLGTVPENIVGLRVEGDSMEPELLEGDVVLVNTHLDNGVTLSEDIYAFRMGNELLIKRLRPTEAVGAGAGAGSLMVACPPWINPDRNVNIPRLCRGIFTSATNSSQA